ncbi:unnamed protein product [Durusdinium trenchii]|uniref:ATP synthase F1 complex delta/epsilon subunit N-terminal domain-containing protein n=2 Tax=Durusdinium trenchii TaxID=1381693 RepID=A0ABP0T0I5_9DINO
MSSWLCSQKAGSRERLFLRILVLVFAAFRWQESFAVVSGGTDIPGEPVTVDRILMKVLTIEGMQLKTVVSEVSLPGLEGRLGILRGHAPLIAPLACGLLRYKRQGKWVPIVLRGGIMEVREDVVTVLTNDAERGAEIPTPEEARRALERCTETLSCASGTEHPDCYC